MFAVAGVGGGLGTAWYMVEAGSRLSTRTFGPWTTWTAAGRPDADPYTRAHTFRNAPAAACLDAGAHLSRQDRQQRRAAALRHANTPSSIEPLDGAWWSLAAFDARASLIPNSAERHAFNSDTVMREPDGRAVITLARDARPGNWLPIGGGGRITLVLTVQDAAWRAASVHEGGAAKPLPDIRRMICR